MADTYLQVRTDSKEKEEATKILDALGTNVSQVVNMLLKQIILKQEIPFEMDLGKKGKVSGKLKDQAVSDKVIPFQKPDSSKKK